MNFKQELADTLNYGLVGCLFSDTIIRQQSDYGISRVVIVSLLSEKLNFSEPDITKECIKNIGLVRSASTAAKQSYKFTINQKAMNVNSR